MGLLSIMARLGLNTSGFEVGLKRVESLSQKTGNLVSGHLKGQLAAAFGVYALQRASAETIKFGSELTDLSKIASTTTARMQELNYAATQDGATMQDMTKAMRKLAEAREDALKNPGGDKASAFANFGIGAAELASLKDMGELLLRVGDGVKGVNLDANSTPQILSLIGTKGSAILPAMIAGLRESGDEAKRLNLILGTETVAALDRMGDAADRMWLGLKGPIAEMTVGVLRLLLDLNALVRMLPSVGTLIASGFLLPFAKAFEFIDAGFDKLMGVKSDGKFTAQRKKLEAELLAA
ncbi:MAG TPA: hypothetical protein VNT99_08230, partial [Methylomirabilota bacterium]|nr:hypothetical protein [Methylomirabilota bacterium]